MSMLLSKTYSEKLRHVVEIYKLNEIDIVKVINKYPNSSLYKKILSKSSEWLDEDEINLRKILKDTSHHRDFRNPREYAFNIILNWLIEDLVFWILFRSGANVKKFGFPSEPISPLLDILSSALTP